MHDPRSFEILDWLRELLPDHRFQILRFFGGEYVTISPVDVMGCPVLMKSIKLPDSEGRAELERYLRLAGYVAPDPLPETLPAGTRLLPSNEWLQLELEARLVFDSYGPSYSGPWAKHCTGAHPNNVDWSTVPKVEVVG